MGRPLVRRNCWKRGLIKKEMFYTNLTCILGWMVSGGRWMGNKVISKGRVGEMVCVGGWGASG